MRKWHRWLVVFFGVFLLWIAGTGVGMQLADVFGGEGPPPAAAKAAAPEGKPAAPKPKPQDLHHILQHLHSGETFGPLGTVINTLSGLALLFFSFSGLWMYIQMWRNRNSRALKPGWFWK
jgi:uncharacterized iron-regulated membrane protein